MEEKKFQEIKDFHFFKMVTQFFYIIKLKNFILFWKRSSYID